MDNFLLVLDDFDDRMWRQNAKDTLESEIERGYQDLEEFPRVEGSLKPKSHEHKIKTKEEGAALKRLDDMYEDPHIGPDFFLKTTKKIGSCLRRYRLCKSHPEFGKFFHCSTPSPGIILHFNSVTAKKEIFVLLPSGDQPRRKPAKLQISHLIKWHQNRKAKALATQEKELELKQALREVLLQALVELEALEGELNELHGQFEIGKARFILKLTSKMASMDTRSKVTEKYIERVADSVQLYNKIKDNIAKLKNEVVSLNPRMYGEKEYTKMSIDNCNAFTKLYLDQVKQMKNILSMI